MQKRKLRHTKHRTPFRIRRNQTSETRFGTNCPKSEPNAVANVSFLYTKQTVFRGWRQPLSIARQAGVSLRHTSAGGQHEERRRCAREGMRHPGPVRHPAPEARRRRDTSEAPGGMHTLGRSAARRCAPCSREKNSWLPRAGTQYISALRGVIDACPITCRNPHARAVRGCRTACDSPLHAEVRQLARQLRGRCRAPSAPAPHAKADAPGGH